MATAEVYSKWSSQGAGVRGAGGWGRKGGPANAGGGGGVLAADVAPDKPLPVVSLMWSVAVAAVVTVSAPAEALKFSPPLPPLMLLPPALSMTVSRLMPP